MIENNATEKERRVILIADDDEVMGYIMSSLLEKAGHQVTLVTDGKKAIEVLGARADIELVITDLQMPGALGTEVLMMLKDTSHKAEAWLTSGGISKDTIQDAKDLGATQTFDKRKVVSFFKEQGLIPS